ncbi:glycosyltransferase [Mycobacterium helveticum]|uniref:Glycosyltransferase n=2 Tax=Mycobacterium helveticum TaxID=2592811 RepID=A0A557XW46_9MYCO|nr:glycosyltransferase [Mycobacterium helveticum]TVS90259.1 glycosyltransferase [Mycobacterium helveticum]
MYNNGATIERCLRSILQQDGVDFEIVVVDDASTDDGAAIAVRMLRPGDRLIYGKPRAGLNGNHNRCLEYAHGTCIQFVHGDDWLLPGALSTLSGYFDDPNVGLAFAPRHVKTDDLKWLRRCGNPPGHFWGLKEYNDGPWLVTQMMLQGGKGNWIGEPTCVMFRRELALEVGGLRDDIFQLVDLDFWYRLMLRSAVCFVPRELSVRSHSGGTETARNVTTRRWWLDHLRILSWLIVDSASPAAVRIMSTFLWPPAWLVAMGEVMLFGPQRWSRLKILAQAPYREFAHARRLRDDPSRPAAVLPASRRS